MGKAIGGYVRRCERRYVPPVPDDGIPRCERCGARLDLCVVSPVHICKEFTFGTPLSPLRFETFPLPEPAQPAAPVFPAACLSRS